MTDPTPPRRERLAIQFQDLGRQEHAARFGMWLFLTSEVLLFAGLFALYSAYRTEYPVDFAAGVRHNALAIGTTNTAVLILSSFTVAWAVHSVRRARHRIAVWSLAITMLLGTVFLVLKGVEYGEHFHEGIFPGVTYSYAGLPTHGGQLFFTLYYFMTGLHALHMIGGIAVMSWLTSRVVRRRTTPVYHAELEMGALYWHLVDSIWIFLWPLFYLTT
jgi:cytochrome c oxidase subunit 3